MEPGGDTVPARILIVDDLPENLALLADIISGFGYRVATAGSGEEALRAAAERSPDVVLLDIMMPGMDGFEVCRRLKRDPSTRHLPVILLSALNDVQDKITGFRAGAVDYIQKPWRTEEVMIRMENQLALRRMRLELEARNTHLQKEIRERERSQLAAERHRQEMERKNRELAALYRISQALNRTIEMEELFDEVLQALREIMTPDLKGAIFLAEGGSLRLASSISLTEMNLQPCLEIPFGQCLCGLAAETGEILVSEDSSKDPRHILRNPALEPHGHIVLPLKAAGRVVGVLSLHTEPGVAVSSSAHMFLSTICSQIGNAVNNARRFEESRNSSLHDPLTGLANRRLLEIQQDALLESVHRYGDPLSVIMLDIDHFKRFNDLHGHLEGDRVLVEVSDILRRESRHADHVFRFGGEEFLVVLPRSGLESALRAAERLRAAAESNSEVTLSLGVATWEEGSDMKSLIRDADAALYRAKQQGRNRVGVSPESQWKTVRPESADGFVEEAGTDA